MKSQDLLLLLKLLCLEISSNSPYQSKKNNGAWQDWKDEMEKNDAPIDESIQSYYTVRALSSSTSISKSEISLSLQRCYEISLAKLDPELNIPKVNKKALLDFIIYGVRYVFPAKIGPLSRGIATSFAAPVLRKKLMTAGETVFVWPDAQGKSKGQAIGPIHGCVPYAVRQDSLLYLILALIDAIRIGAARERNLAIKELSKYFEETDE